MEKNRLKNVPVFFMILVCFMVLSACEDVASFFGLDQEIIGIEVTKKPAKLTYARYAAFDPAGMEVTATFADFKKRTIPASEYTVTLLSLILEPTDMNTLGKKIVQVDSIEGVLIPAFFTITVVVETESSPYLDYITVTKLPKTEYFAGAAFDPEGLEVTATYVGKASRVLEDFEYTLSKPDMYVVGAQPVNVDCEGKIATFTILIHPAPDAQLASIAITQTPEKTVYYVNDPFEPEGLIVTALYSDYSEKEVTGYTLSAPAMTPAGTKTVTVTFQDKTVTKTANFTIEVIPIPPVTLASIEVTHPPTKTAYIVGEVFNPAGLVVTGTYNNSTTREVTRYTSSSPNGYTLSTPDMGSVGTKTITVTFTDESITKTAAFIIMVDEAPLESIAITAHPTKTEYWVNETFNPAGLAITGTYSDNSKKTVTGYTLSAPDMGSAGTKTVTVTFDGKITSFTITVNTPVLSSIAATTLPAKTTYFVNETFNPAGLVVTATYSDSSKKTVTNYTLTAPDMSTNGTKPVTVTFEDKPAAFNITVNTPVLNEIAVTGPSKTVYFVNETFSAAGLIVTATYSDNSKKAVTGYTLSAPVMGSAGTKTVTVTFTENNVTKTTSFTIMVNTPVLNSIAVTTIPTKTVYIVNESFSSAGLVVTGTYSDGSTKAVTGYSLSTPTMSTTGNKTVTVTFESRTTTFTITVDPDPTPWLNSIAVTTNPTKTVYWVGDTFSSAGLVVTGTYYSASAFSHTAPVTGYTLSSPVMSSAGTKTITVTFTENNVTKTTSFTITVNTPVLNSIAVTGPSKTTYFVNETFSSAGLAVTGTYSDGSTKNITGYSVSSPTMSTTGTKTVTVTFDGKTAAFDITVNPILLDSITLAANSVKTVYIEGEAFNPAGLVVTGRYNNSTTKTVTGYTLSAPDMSTTGSKTVTVTFDGKTATFNITVNPAQLVSIAVTTTPARTVYTVGDTFSSAGLEITGTYNNNTTKEITNSQYSLSSPAMNSTGTKTVTVTFDGKTTSFTITVNPKKGDVDVIIY